MPKFAVALKRMKLVGPLHKLSQDLYFLIEG